MRVASLGLSVEGEKKHHDEQYHVYAAKSNVCILYVMWICIGWSLRPDGCVTVMCLLVPFSCFFELIPPSSNRKTGRHEDRSGVFSMYLKANKKTG